MTWKTLVLVLSLTWCHAQNKDVASYLIDIKLNTSSQAVDVETHITIPSGLAAVGDTIWFHMRADAFTRTNNAYTDQTLALGDASFYFRNGPNLASLSNIHVGQAGQSVPYFYKSENEEFLGVVLTASMDRTKPISIFYQLKMPTLYDGFGILDGNYYLKYCYPFLVNKMDGQWVFDPLLPNASGSAMKDGPITVHIDAPENYSLVSNVGPIIANSQGKLTISGDHSNTLDIVLLNKVELVVDGTMGNNSSKIPYQLIFTDHQNKASAKELESWINESNNTMYSMMGLPNVPQLTFIVTDKQHSQAINDNVIHIPSFRTESAYKRYLHDQLLPYWTDDSNIGNEDTNVMEQNWKVKFYSFNKDYRPKQILIYPIPLYTDNDGFTIGIHITNALDRNRPGFNFSLTPLYSIKNNQILGLGRVNYKQISENNVISSINYSLGIKSFDMNTNTELGYTQRFIRLDPSVTLSFRHDDQSNIRSSVKFTRFYISEAYPTFENNGVYLGLYHERSYINRFTYLRSKDNALSSSGYQLDIEHQSYQSLDEPKSYIKVSQAITQRYMYANKKNIYFRLFGAAFVSNSSRATASYQNVFARGSIALIHQGFNDYTYDDFYLSRQNQNKTQDKQVSLDSGGGFKTPIGSTYSIGMSNNWAASLNMSADLPFRLPKWLPIRVYFDIGTYSTYQNNAYQNNVMYNGGLSINWQDVFAIHIPLVFSKELGNTYNGQHTTFLTKISFTLNTKKW